MMKKFFGCCCLVLNMYNFKRGYQTRCFHFAFCNLLSLSGEGSHKAGKKVDLESLTHEYKENRSIYESPVSFLFIFKFQYYQEKANCLNIFSQQNTTLFFRPTATSSASHRPVRATFQKRRFSAGSKKFWRGTHLR